MSAGGIMRLLRPRIISGKRGVELCDHAMRRIFRRAALSAALAALVVALPAQSAVQAATTFTVTSTASGSDADTVNGTPHDGVCADVDGNCTLRAAIEEANANAGADTIAFDVPGTGVHTITPTGPFSDGAALRVTDPVTIDGTSQPGYVDRPVIELDGSHLINLTTTSQNGLTLANGSGGSTIRALAINGFSGPASEAIEIQTDSNHIEGNYLGVDATGTAAKANSLGIGVAFGSSNRIGGTSAAARNVISGNTTVGVAFGSGAGTGNLVQGNLIGTNAAGTAAIPNAGGVEDLSAFLGASENTIGGTAQGAGNVISGNTEDGVGLFGSGGDLVQGNRIGTSLDGTAPIPNGRGVLADGTDDTIGGTTASARNVISGNSANGITIGGGFLATGNEVEGNLIGTNAAGTASIPNGGAGVLVTAASSATIGGPTADAGNVISGNGNSGITISGVFETPNHVESNLIGTNAAGTAAIPNTGPGIWVVGPGRAGTIAGNLIAGNTGPGIRIDYGSPNPIEDNSIYSNGGLGIDLGGDGVTPNDPGDTDDPGPNKAQNFPVIDRALSDGSTVTIEGSLDSNASSNGINYRLEFFANDACDDSGFGEGKTFLGAVSLTTQPDGTGSFTKTFDLPAGAGSVITSTATDPAGNTSEFSGCLETSSGGRIVVAKQTFPASSTPSFAFTASYAPSGFALSDGQSNDSGPLEPGSYTVSEAAISSWDLTSASCDNGNNPSAITLAAGQTVTCKFVNTQRGLARVVKTVNGAVPSGGQSFTFQLRQGASTTAAGTILAQLDANAGDGGIVNFTTKLVPGTTYALCEIVMPGWMTSLGPPFYVVYNPSGDNSAVCSDFTVQPGQTRTFAIDNKPPPGGLARTIGFWKNWASCASSTGKQKPVLDQTLAAAGPAGITIGTLTLHAGDCLKAIRLLNKSTVDTGKKMASDPAFNLAAQLLAAELNVVAGAGTCPAAVSAINDAQTLLAAIHFNGITHDKLSAAQNSQANGLATTLDRYNNNLLC